MTEYFDELIQMWHKTTNEHVEWQRKAKTLSMWELFEYVKRLGREEDEFEKKTEHMQSDNASNHTSILAAKFKNRYAINRFLVSVQMELFLRLFELLEEISKKYIERKTSAKPTKIIMSKELKKAIADQVKHEISKYKKELKIKK